MSIIVINGNIFTSKCQTLVNTVNCVGVMGAGIALEYRLRYPAMYVKYKHLCKAKQIQIGQLWIYKSSDRWILNFPTKQHWKYPSKEYFLEAGLRKFRETHVEKGISSIAFPLLGADRGGISADTSLSIMRSHLEECSIPIEIYRYDANAYDDLYLTVKNWLLSSSIDEVARITDIRENYIVKVVEAMRSEKIRQLNQLAAVPGIGIKTLEKLFYQAQSNKSKSGRTNPVQQSII